MTTQEFIENLRQPHVTGIHHPYMELLDKLIAESRKEIFQEDKTEHVDREFT